MLLDMPLELAPLKERVTEMQLLFEAIDLLLISFKMELETMFSTIVLFTM
jgi:hypothetical protein